MNIDNIVVVGGGTAGWLAAAYLSKNLPDVKITVVDKTIGTPVGVGEGTLTNFEPYLKKCGFDVSEWFAEIDATYKSGILFPGWGSDQNNIWHPFFKNHNPALFDRFSIHDLWTQNQHLDFKKYALAMYETSIDYNKVDTDNLSLYAYHVDCHKLVKYIQRKIIDKIQLIESDVVSINRNDNNVVSLELKNGSIITADLFIDCTGFKGILKETNKRVNLEGRLFCDTAVAGHVPYIDKEKELNPYVISEQVDHGWVWNIPVKDRIGSGLVFNRSCTDIEDAKDFFCNYWDNRISKENLKVIDWTPFYNSDQWQGNVVSIGLSAGFIEPLESTGIALMMAGVSKLHDLIITQQYTQTDIDFFNLQMSIYFEDCVDFVSMHYATPHRDTKFWNWVKNTWNSSDKFKWYKEKLLDSQTPIPTSGKFSNIFTGSNWVTWMIQLGYPIAKRNTTISDNASEKIILKSYSKYEKHRHVWSRNHVAEINRRNGL